VDAERSAVQHVREQLGLEVAAIATLEDLLQYLATTEDPALAGHAAAVRRYRERYGV
jgi:orotate phosphoribosyltransferase